MTTDTPVPYSARFREARERAGLSRDDAAARMDIPADCIWDIETRADELCTSYSPADIQRFCQVLAIRPADLFLIQPTEPPITAQELAALIHDHCRTHNITIPQFEDAVGWRLTESLIDPEDLFEDLSIDGLRWVCDELGIDWRRVILSL